MVHGSPLSPLPSQPPIRLQSSASMPDIAPASMISAPERPGNLALTPPQVTAICTIHHRSSARIHNIPTPHRSSPPPLPPSSDDPLAPVPSTLTRGLHPRHTHRTCLPPRHHKTSPGSFNSAQADERPSSTSALPWKLYLHQRLPSAPCPTETQPKDMPDSGTLIPFKRRRIMDLQCEEVATVPTDDVPTAREDDRKLVMWRAACAMAHAYLHRQGHHRPDLHHGNRLEESSTSHHVEFDEALGSKMLQVNRHVVKEESLNKMGWQIEHIHTLHPSSGSSTTSSSKDGVSTPSSYLAAGDVVCIDEIVNPTMAAEWFGALSSMTSTLVS